MGTKNSYITEEMLVPVQNGGEPPPILLHDGFKGDGDSRRRHTPDRTYRTGVWLFMAAVTMAFAGLTSTIVVRQSTAPDWGHVSLPPFLYVNTVVILLSSLSLEAARRKGSASSTRAAMNWLYVTLALGLLFVGGQNVAWKILVERGVYLASRPSSSTFYILTGIHALHLMGGILALAYLVSRMHAMRPSRFNACIGATSLYWHFMSALWVYVLLLLVTIIK